MLPAESPSVAALNPGDVSSPEHSPAPAKPVTVNDSARSASIFDAREIWTYRDLLYFLTWRDIKVRYKQAAIGAVWAILQPLAIMLIFAVFFGLFLGVKT